jgi:arginase
VTANEIRLLIVPYELATLRKGVGRGPERLLESGAEEALGARGATVTRELLELDRDFNEHSGDNEIDASFDLMRMVSERVRAAVRDGAFPVVLSGSCFAAVGVVAGLEERSPGVVWLDAHADFNSPQTSDSGYLDGMGVRMLVGGAWPGLLGGIKGLRPLAETSVVIAGARDFDEPEKRDLDASAVAALPPDQMRSPQSLLEAIGALAPTPTGLYLHVDLDVLDAEVAGVNVYSAPDGVSADELQSLVESVLAHSEVRAFSLTAYDPESDADDRVPPIAMGLLRAVAERVDRAIA